MKLHAPALEPSKAGWTSFALTGASLGIVVLAITALTACSKKIDAASRQVDKAPASPKTTLTPAIQPVLSAWEQGDAATAVSRFVQTDWSARPLFPIGSALSLSEKEFQALPAAQRDAKGSELTAQAGVLKQLTTAVAQAGREAATKRDFNQARKHFTSLKQYGEALDAPDSLMLIKLVGRSVKRMAETELGKLKS
jgi:hypothetical protein